jgi:hypothetical protein
MFKKPKLPITAHLLRELSLITILISLGVTVFTVEHQSSQKLQTNLRAHISRIDTLNQQVGDLELQHDQLNEAYQLVSTDSAVLANEAWQNSVELYSAIEAKFNDYTKKGLDLEEYQDSLDSSLALLLKGKYDDLSTSVNELDTQFEDLMAQKIEEDKKKAAEAAAKQAAASVVSAPVSSSPGAGYSRITVSTEKGSFVTDMIMVDLGAVKVVTITGQDGNCDNNCVTKPLATYVAENSGFAGINGTYFCPPDYGSCAGKVSSFDFPVYNSVHGKWINEDKLFWSGRAMMAFPGGNQARFCADASGCNRGGITAGIVNYPALINNGHIVVNPGSLPDVLKNTRGYRGAIGVSGNWLYLMVVRGATVPHVAYVMKALGISNGMNLDGGGSTALYYHGYKVGPGRSLPNAVVLRY